MAHLPDAVRCTRALVVVAHPDDESFGLGGILAALSTAGTSVRLLCLTRGEASTLGTLGAEIDLAEVRRLELARAAGHLGVEEVYLEDFPDGALSTVDAHVLDGMVESHLKDAAVLVVFEPGGVTGHPDHRAASAAAERTAVRRDLLLMEWGVGPDVAATLRRETGVPFVALDGPGVIDLVVDRSRQRAAIGCHASQATDNPVLTRRLALQGDRERIRLRSPRPGGDPTNVGPGAAPVPRRAHPPA